MTVHEFLIHVNHKAFHLPKFEDEFRAKYGNDPDLKLEAIRVPPAVAKTYAANPAKDLLLRVSSRDPLPEQKVIDAVQKAVTSESVQCVMNPVR